MKLLETIVGNKKKCRACGEEFTVEPLTCPKCGGKQNNRVAEKWGAMIGAFIGAFAGLCFWENSLKEYIIDEAGGDGNLLVCLALPKVAEFITKDDKVCSLFGLGRYWFIGGAVVGCLLVLLVVLVVKKIIRIARA